MYLAQTCTVSRRGATSQASGTPTFTQHTKAYIAKLLCQNWVCIGTFELQNELQRYKIYIKYILKYIDFFTNYEIKCFPFSQWTMSSYSTELLYLITPLNSLMTKVYMYTLGAIQPASYTLLPYLSFYVYHWMIIYQRVQFHLGFSETLAVLPLDVMRES